jgi:Flp pilus assembly protein TadG
MVGIGRRFVRHLRHRLRALHAAEDGSVAIIFAIALIPVLTGLGVAIDFSRVNATRAQVQSALDSALLAGAKDGSTSWTTVALDIFNANLASKLSTVPTPTFTKDSSGVYAGSVLTSVPTAMLGVVGIESVPVTIKGKATAAEGDNSCILTLDGGQSASHTSMTFNGAPNVNLTGCSIRSNTSANCNGHSGNATKTYAAGTASGCSNPTTGAAVIPDIYKDLATNISTSCGGLRPGYTWTAGTNPSGGAVKTVPKTGYMEYHICGDLTLTGTGYLTGSAPTSDSVIIVENGSINVGNNATISTLRTAIVLTGSNSFAAQINFPNGNGKAATLNLSPPTGAGNPWQGVSLYLDPKLTKTVDNTWGPGAALNADGLVYLATSNVTTNGNAASGNSKCTKFVVNTLRTNGSINLNFAQQNCEALGLKQAAAIPGHLVE